MNLSALARDMLVWERKRRELDELEAAIKDSVLQLGKTQTVGNVRATYSNPRNSYDYEGGVEAAELDNETYNRLVGKHTKRTIDWRGLCKDEGIDPIVTPGSGPGSVSLKLIA